MRAPDGAAVPASLWQGIATAPWAMALPVLLLGTFSLLFGEQVPAGGGSAGMAVNTLRWFVTCRT